MSPSLGKKEANIKGCLVPKLQHLKVVPIPDSERLGSVCTFQVEGEEDDASTDSLTTAARGHLTASSRIQPPHICLRAGALLSEASAQIWVGGRDSFLLPSPGLWP